AEPDHQDLLDRRRGAAAADAGRLGLRHELQEYTRARMVVRLSLCAVPDRACGDPSVSLVPSHGLAVTAGTQTGRPIHLRCRNAARALAAGVPDLCVMYRATV